MLKITDFPQEFEVELLKTVKFKRYKPFRGNYSGNIIFCPEFKSLGELVESVGGDVVFTMAVRQIKTLCSTVANQNNDYVFSFNELKLMYKSILQYGGIHKKRSVKKKLCDRLLDSKISDKEAAEILKELRSITK